MGQPAAARYCTYNLTTQSAQGNKSHSWRWQMRGGERLADEVGSACTGHKVRTGVAAGIRVHDFPFPQPAKLALVILRHMTSRSWARCSGSSVLFRRLNAKHQYNTLGSSVPQVAYPRIAILFPCGHIGELLCVHVSHTSLAIIKGTMDAGYVN